ncbi:anthranilate synthase component II [Fusibacter sp. JL216-2]|uniref:anthranilate synthase component II n=1 Tax=Fusibacter sp. JL216-2 TaxID=3071453 RepID=UPI003D329DB0
MILVIDNYDSFTYNIVQYLGILNKAVTVWRNDAFELEAIKALDPEAIILSPGPGHPEEAGLTLRVIETYKTEYPILGICLGHQAIGHSEGALVNKAKDQLHGKTSIIHHEEGGIFEGIVSPVEVVRYHSLVIDVKSLPEQLTVLARDEKGEIMAVKHKDHPLYGLQFHPESYSTSHGMAMLENFINIAKNHKTAL